MCMKNCQPVSEYNSPCGSCPEYLNSCMPVVINGFLIECDLCFCEWCSCYDDCMNGGVDEEINQLVEPYEKQVSDNEMEKLKEMLSMVGLTAEQAGFENGVRFAVKFLYSLLSD